MASVYCEKRSALAFCMGGNPAIWAQRRQDSHDGSTHSHPIKGTRSRGLSSPLNPGAATGKTCSAKVATQRAPSNGGLP